jgi:dienelactone hydrolase
MSVNEHGFAGTYFAPPHGEDAPAVLQLGGSLGGHAYQPAGLLASHGYPALSLAYFNEPGLPPALRDIPLEYFANALRWLSSQPGVDPSRVTVLGVSRGGEAALLLGATYPQLVHAVIACSPSSFVLGAHPGSGDAWTINGKPIPYGYIHVEDIAGPVLVTGGGKDAIWPSAAAVRDILERAREHHRDDITGHVYPNAGHGVGCIFPNVPASARIQIAPNAFVDTGGTPTANERARADSWSLLLRFLDELR